MALYRVVIGINPKAIGEDPRGSGACMHTYWITAGSEQVARDAFDAIEENCKTGELSTYWSGWRDTLPAHLSRLEIYDLNHPKGGLVDARLWGLEGLGTVDLEIEVQGIPVGITAERVQYQVHRRGAVLCELRSGAWPNPRRVYMGPLSPVAAHINVGSFGLSQSFLTNLPTEQPLPLEGSGLTIDTWSDQVLASVEAHWRNVAGDLADAGAQLVIRTGDWTGTPVQEVHANHVRADLRSRGARTRWRAMVDL